MSETKPAEARRLTGVAFVDAVGFGVHKSFAIGQSCESIVPAALLPDGDWAGVDKGQQAVGIGIRRVESFGTERRVSRYFVPFANVAELVYGFDDKK